MISKKKFFFFFYIYNNLKYNKFVFLNLFYFLSLKIAVINRMLKTFGIENCF